MFWNIVASLEVDSLQYKDTKRAECRIPAPTKQINWGLTLTERILLCFKIIKKLKFDQILYKKVWEVMNFEKDHALLLKGGKGFARNPTPEEAHQTSRYTYVGMA